MKYHRGPLTSLPPDCVFSAPDGDIPLGAYKLPYMPVLVPLERAIATGQPIVYLEAHRAPEATLAALKAAPAAVIVAGDPEALGHMDGVASAALSSAPEQAPPVFYLEMAASIHEALDGARGLVRVLVADRNSRDVVYSRLRPDGLKVGDRVHDFTRKCTAQVVAKEHGHLKLDLNDIVVHPDHVSQRVVETPATWGSGECDTMVIMPDVSASMGYRASRRVRYKMISVGLAPEMFALKFDGPPRLGEPGVNGAAGT